MPNQSLKYLLFVVILLCGATHKVLAQANESDYEHVVASIKQALNSGNSNSIYQLTNESFQSRMSPQQFSSGMNRFKAKNGICLEIIHQTQSTNGRDFYARFELSEQILSLSLDNNGKVQQMNFQEIPFVKGVKDFKVNSDNPLKTRTDHLVDSLAAPYIQQSHTSALTLAIIDNGKVSTYSYGSTDKHKSTLPNPYRTIFEIGSVTKTFTSLLLAKQVTNGKMALADPLQKYLPDSIGMLSFEGEPIRLVHLANHTSGFPRLPENIFNGNVDPKNPYLHYTVDSLFSYLRHYRMKAKAGKHFSYSNYGAGLLGTILEIKTGISFQDLINKDITVPLKMASTFIDIPDDRKSDLAIGYNERGIATSRWDLASLKGSGAINSTLMDMVKYTKAQLTGKAPLANAIAHSHLPTFKSDKQHMALGWRIEHLGQQSYLHHAGGTGGFRSFVGFSREKQLGVVILSNTAEEVADMGEALIKTLMKK